MPKKKDPSLRMTNLRIDQMLRAPSLHQGFPNVERITVTINEKPEDNLGGAPRTYTRVLEGEKRAYFHFDCRYEVTDNCANGGLTLDGEIQKLIEEKKSNLEGSTVCYGKQGGLKRAGHHTCLLPYTYAIKIDYK